ncbi:arylsulfatase [Acinetobacter sp. ANC 5584]
MIKKNRLALAMSLLITGISTSYAAPQHHHTTSEKQPNVLVILADDLGWSDIGAFGGEISTPHLDQLARQGIKFTNFQVSPYSSPSRAMFLTGADPHQVGLGNIHELNTKEQMSSPNYVGHLTPQSLTIAQRLQQAGYFTVMSGKWHLGTEDANSPDHWGFSHSFAMLRGEANHFKYQDKTPTPDGEDIYRIDGKMVDIPENFYSSDAYTDYLLNTLKHKSNKQPFFAYLAYTAPHSPLQAPQEDIEKYKNFYKDGPQKLAEQRLIQEKKLGLVAPSTQPHKLINVKPWESLSKDEQLQQSRRMQIYAAMIDRMDYNIGRVIKSLKDSGELDNTVIIFMSDNGAAGASREQSGRWGSWIASNRDNSYANMGKANSYVSIGPSWAQASMTPFALFKGFTSEGGIHAPLIISGPNITKGKIEGSYHNLTDLAPTILNLAHASTTTPTNKVALQGTSFTSRLNTPNAKITGPEHAVALEMLGGREVRQGDYKALYVTKEPIGISSPELKAGEWQLFNIVKDPGETNNIAAQHPEILQKLIAAYQQYSKKVGVVEITPMK